MLMHTYINRTRIVKPPPLDDLILAVLCVTLVFVLHNPVFHSVTRNFCVYKIVHCWDSYTLQYFTHNSHLEHKIMQLGGNWHNFNQERCLS